MDSWKASLCGVALILAATPFCAKTSDSFVPLWIGKPSLNCGDGRWVFAKIVDDGSLELNGSPVGKDAAPQIIQQIMSTRVEPVLYLQADRDLAMKEFIAFADRVEARDRRIEVVWVTDQVTYETKEEMGCISVPRPPRWSN